LELLKLKLHEKNPDAPLSPFYINLRDRNNPKPGPLDQDDYDLIAHCLLAIINDNQLTFQQWPAFRTPARQ